MAALKLSEILVEQGVVRPDQMAKVLEDQKKTGNKISQILISQGLVKDIQILKALEKHFQIPGIDLSSFEIDPAVTALVPKEVCEKHHIIPIQKAGNTLVVAFSDPTNIFIRDDLSFLTRCKIQTVIATEHAIGQSIDKYYGGNYQMSVVNQKGDGDDEEFVFAGTQASEIISEGNVDDAPIVKFVSAILVDAIKKKASDIHFEPYEKKYRIRFRVDGNLIEMAAPPQESGSAIASRLKIMSKLDIAEKRKPQDGRIKIKTVKGKEMDFRVSTLPTLWGEKVVLRLLDKSNLQLDMTKLGFEPEDLKLFKSCIHIPQGLVLITGPTGSGKTTTIYSALAELNQPDVNISTAEDPIEFNLEGINQVQMNPDIDLNFSTALKAFLRQDPDIVMVGEIRDLETAEIAFKAASTGHLVVSTLHTNDAPSTIIRLTEMGVAGYLVASTVTLIVAQRLVGKNCENCKAPFEVPAQTLIDLGVDPQDVGNYKLMKGRGCNNCSGSGIKGRLGVYELLSMTEAIREAVIKGASTAELRILAREQGLKTLRRSALLHLKRGLTTIEEVLNSSVKDTE